MKIEEAICTGNSRYKANQKLNPVGVVLHSIGCSQPDARVLQRSWQNNASPYVTQYILDDVRCLHTMPDDRKCWHVGSPGNARWIGIEMCEPSSIKYIPGTGAKFIVKDMDAARAYCRKTYHNAVELLAMLCRKYGWNPETAILTHGEITRKKLSDTDHVDPEHLWNGLGLGYNLATLRRDVTAEMQKEPAGNQAANSPSVKLDPVATFTADRKGTYTVKPSNGLRLRAGASTKKPIIEVMKKGSKVRCYGYHTGQWLYVVSASGKVGYCHINYLKRKEE